MSKENSLLAKFEAILGDNGKLMVIKGRLMNITKDLKRDSKDEEYYYSADVKVMHPGAEGYNSSFDMFHLIFPVAVSMAITDAEMIAMKNNEVIALVSPSCRVNTFKNDEPDENGEIKIVKYNKCTFYVNDIMKTKDVEKQEFTPSCTYNL